MAVPIYDQKIRERLIQMFNTMLSDTCKLRVQQDGGEYKKAKSEGESFNSQEYFAEESYKKAGVPIPE